MQESPSRSDEVAITPTTLEPSVTEPAVAPEPLQLPFILFLLAGLLLSVLIVLANLLIVSAIVKFYRVQTASNCFLLTLSMSDGLIGVLLPVALLLQLAGPPEDGYSAPLCLLPYCALAALSTVSILTTVAIAADRFTSLAQPLRYNNLVTRRGVQRYAAACWLYGLLVGLTPLALTLRQKDSSTGCGLALLDRTAAGALAGLVFLPVAGVMVTCYLYVYCVARTHAKAIQTVEVSLGRSGGGSARCGQTLALTVGAFLLCWSPLCLCLVTQSAWFYDSGTARGWLSLLALSSAALNPFLYSFHSAELRYSCRRLLESVLGRCGVVWWGSVRSGSAAYSTASNIRLCTMATNHTCIIREVCVQGTGSDAVSLYRETVVSTHLGVANPITPV
ncbi:Adenosine receptor A2a [Amphibalanus amphitrite]|uniref:Adenosine receptor A2a n=1 Tax=Amphibalanus amphitrite TaxID=1232801 RepID=A0A6A4X5U3_AMPAM|nr:Adenosine receptor A2a [Amphibalanus amphitrite]